MNFLSDLGNRIDSMSGADPNSASSRIFQAGQRAVAPAQNLYKELGALSPGSEFLSPEEQQALLTAIRLGTLGTGGLG